KKDASRRHARFLMPISRAITSTVFGDVRCQLLGRFLPLGLCFTGRSFVRRGKAFTPSRCLPLKQKGRPEASVVILLYVAFRVRRPLGQTRLQPRYLRQRHG